MSEVVQNQRSLQNLKNFAPGVSGNPGGKPVGLRNSINTRFLQALSDAFDKRGREAINAVISDDPSTFLRVLIALQPKELEIKTSLDDVNDEQLNAALIAVRSILAARTGTAAPDPGRGTETPQSAESPA